MKVAEELTLSNLVASAIALKPGEDFALFFFPPDDWRADMVNPAGKECSTIQLGEGTAEFSAEGATPEEAVSRLIELIRSQP